MVTTALTSQIPIKTCAEEAKVSVSGGYRVVVSRWRRFILPADPLCSLSANFVACRWFDVIVPTRRGESVRETKAL